MLNFNDKIGYFVFSLDTELATGFFDADIPRKEKFSPNGSRERKSIKKILDILDEFDIAATWAIVGHLFYKECEHCQICPIKDWKGKYRSFEEAYGTNHPLWYGADVIDEILSRGARHEIGFHGYTHEIFNERTMTLEKAQLEIIEWKRVASRLKIIPTSITFPRGQAGFLHLFKENDFICYRGEEYQPLIIRNKYFGYYLKLLDHILSISMPPIYDIKKIQINQGLVNIPGSQDLFLFDGKVDIFLDSKNLSFLRIKRIIKGIKKAAREKKIIHIWAHPWEFQTQYDFERLRLIFSTVKKEIQKEAMCSVTMTDLAKIIFNKQSKDLKIEI